MDNFDLIKFLAEGKLNENIFDVAATTKIAQAVADAFTADDELDLKYVINPRIDAGHFDLDVEAGPNTPGEDWKDVNGFSIDNYLGDLAGGSFYIKDGVVYNAASRNAPVANVTPEGEVEMISAADSRAAIDSQDNIPAIDRMYNSDAWVQAQRDAMEESEMLDEGLFDTVKDKVLSMGKKLLSKFAPEELASMKAAAEKVLGPNYSKEDITLDKAKEIGKIISGGLDESQELDENLRQKIGGALAGIGLPLAFIAGNTATTDAGLGVAVVGIVAAMIGWVMTLDEAQENKPSNKMKKSELKEMIRAAMLAEMEVEETEVFEAEEEVADEIEVEDEDVDVEDVDTDVDVEDDTVVNGIDVKQDAEAELGGVKGDVQDNLEAALEAAKSLGDEKLVDQIGNTLTFFTRQHVVKETELEETIEFPMWNRLNK